MLGSWGFGFRVEGPSDDLGEHMADVVRAVDSPSFSEVSGLYETPTEHASLAVAVVPPSRCWLVLAPVVLNSETETTQEQKSQDAYECCAAQNKAPRPRRP